MLNYNINTPILFIVFKYPLTMQRVFETIMHAKPKKLYIATYATLFQFQDMYYKELEKMLSQIDWDCEVNVLHVGNNTEKFRDPVSWLFSYEEEGIILNDGYLPDDSFFGFCSELLEKYRNDYRIGHISGINYNSQETDHYSYYFSLLVNTQAWATWKRVWQAIDMDMLSINSFISSNAIENYLSYVKYKEDWIGWFMRYVFHHEVDDWHKPYTYSNLINSCLSITPSVNLVQAIMKPNSENNQVHIDVPSQTITKLQHPLFVMCNHFFDWNEQKILREAKNKNKLREDLKDGYTFIKDRFLELSKQNKNMKIPHIIHQIYEDPAGPDESLLELAKTWMEHHPTWEYRFWSKEDIEDFLTAEFPEFMPTYKAYPFNVQRWDAIRYLILYKIGGLYVDLDYECLEPIDSLLNNTICCMGMEPRVNAIVHDKAFIVGNALMASIPNHPYFKAMIDEMMNGEKYSTLPKALQIMETTGPFMTTRLYEQYPDKDEITLLPEDLVTPLTFWEIRDMVSGLESSYIEDKVEKCFAIHYFAGSWVSQTTEVKSN
jgi:mannosyltransferase OCH1-like enzyme